MDPGERLELLDAEHIDAVILYTTVGLLWEAELQDPELSQAYTKAYNRWICEFCADSPRLVPTAHLSLSDPAAARELERAMGEGAKGAYVCPVHPRRPAARPPRQPRGVRRRAGPGRAVRHPPDLRAAVDQGRADGHVGERQAAPPARLGHRVRRRAPPVHDAVRLRRVRPVPRAEGAGARVGRRLDRLLARPDRRRLRPHVHRREGAAAGQAERLLPRADLDQLRPRRAHHPGPRRAVRRRPVPVGVGLPPRRPHPRVRARPQRARCRLPEQDRSKFLGDNARTLFGLPTVRG
jgi:hypothetical protein